MKKISLITMHSVQNYGSVLQAYATQQLFESLGYAVETVDFVRENNRRENLVDTGLRSAGFWNKNPLTRLVYKMLKKRTLEKRYDLFSAFVRAHLHLTEHVYYGEEDFTKHPVQADLYCTGSDQTWNTFWNRGVLPPYFLSYAPDGKRKFSYAASFGKKELDPGEAEQIKPLLERYAYLTTREEEAAQIIRGLGLAAQRVLDPTLMLDARTWAAMAQPPAASAPYLLVYQLNQSKEFCRIAKWYAKTSGLKLVRIGISPKDRLLGGSVVMHPTPEQFLGLFRSAACVLTDSFHATGFSINFGIPFSCYLPRKFSGRITDLLSLFGMEDRVFSSKEELQERETLQFDRSAASQKLAEERNRSLAILHEALGEAKGDADAEV